MKKLLCLTVLFVCIFTAQAQYRWELSGGITNSNLNLENTETNNGTSFYFNAGYGYVSGIRAKTSIVFSLEALQRTSELSTAFNIGESLIVRPGAKLSIFQLGFSPKFRYLFNSGKDRFRPFINAGPTFRYSVNAKIGDIELKNDQYEELILGAVYGVGFSQMIGEMFDIFFEAGGMNDFLDNIKDVDSKFFDIYARVGVRIRVYDSRR